MYPMIQKRPGSGKNSGGRKLRMGKLHTRRSVKFPGIMALADKLGEDRMTVTFALNGKRKGKKYQEVLRRIKALKGVKL